MKISMAIGAGASLDPKRLTQHVADLEAAGVDMIWGGEIYGFDLVSTLAYVAAKTERIQLMTGILPIYSRSPAIIAQTAMTIDTLSEGRFILGLGTSGPQVIEGWHGVPFSKPMGRTRDVIEICRKVWSGDKVVHEGSAVSLPYDGGTGLGKPLKLMAKPFRRDIPIAVASIGPRNVEMTAELAEVWQPIHFLPEKFNDVWGESLAAGGARRSDDLADLQIVAGGTVALGDGPMVDAVRKGVRDNVGFYVGGMGARDKNFYNDLFKRYGYVDEAEKIQDLFLTGKRDEAFAAVPDDYVDRASLAGDPERVQERIEVYRSVGVSYLDITIPPETENPLEVISQVKAWAE
ncbi:MAG: LLM class F420-dependent oxidoreductase [Acidimicrobiales bacterium]|nr:LLM class F420-dependent oxidoreductase [Acidimicrobiales bacterium]MYH74819.1 LLM class F420-dependent oxidoreductase [Acidimicrobiales bacterium]MYK70385.1 LLM class F420-dependent oxidoreductase [Acidimicrobiales bacterium]